MKPPAASITQARLSRDLAWCINSPPMLRGQNPLWPDDEWFRSLPRPSDQGIVPAPPYLDRFRLGRHFEQLVFHWLERSEQFHLEQNNLQVNDTNRTVGEFDCLVRDCRSQEIEHWELAVKFYLAVRDSRETSNWYGPDPTDQLSTKLARLEDHQLQLAQYPASGLTLDALGLSVSRVRCFMKGRLFLPLNQFLTGVYQLPARVNTNVSVGWWADWSDFESRPPPEPFCICPLAKQHWLAPLTSQDTMTDGSLNTSVVMSPVAFFDRYRDQIRQEATHIALLDNQGNETSRGFLVSDQWLTRVKATKLTAT